MFTAVVAPALVASCYLWPLYYVCRLWPMFKFTTFCDIITIWCHNGFVIEFRYLVQTIFAPLGLISSLLHCYICTCKDRLH